MHSVTRDIALQFGHWFQVEPQFWPNLHSHFNLGDCALTTPNELGRLYWNSQVWSRCVDKINFSRFGFMIPIQSGLCLV